LEAAGKLLATIINAAVDAPPSLKVSEGEVAGVRLLCSVLCQGGPLPAPPLRVGHWLGRVLLEHKDEYLRDDDLPVVRAIADALRHLMPELPTNDVLGSADLYQLLSAMVANDDELEVGASPPTATVAWVLFVMCASPEQLPVAKLRLGVKAVRRQWWEEYTSVPRGTRPLAGVLGRGYLFMLTALGDRGVVGFRPAGLPHTTKDVLKLLRNRRSTVSTLVGCLRVCANLTKHLVKQSPSARILPLCCMVLDRFPDNATLATLLATIVTNLAQSWRLFEGNDHQVHDLESDYEDEEDSDDAADADAGTDALLADAVLCLRALAKRKPDSQQAVTTFFGCVETAANAIDRSSKFAEVVAGLAEELGRVAHSRSLAHAGVRAVSACINVHFGCDGVCAAFAKFAPVVPGLTAVLWAELAMDDATCNATIVSSCVRCIERISVLIVEVQGLGLEVALDVTLATLQRFSSHVSIALLAVTILRNLATVKSNCVALVPAIPDLFAVLRVHKNNAVPCFHAMRCVQSIMFHVRIPELTATVLPVVVGTLQDLMASVGAAANPKVVSAALVDACLCCLRNACQEDANPPEVLAAMALILDVMRWFSKDASCVESCTHVLRNLAQHGVNCPVVATAVPALTTALWTHIKNDALARAVTKCFMNLSSHLDLVVLEALRPVVALVPKICSDTNGDAVVVQQCAVVQLKVGKLEAELDAAAADADAAAAAAAADADVLIKPEPVFSAPAATP
jgi:hypothetical protein